MSKRTKTEKVTFDKRIHGERAQEFIKQAADFKTVAQAANENLRDLKTLALEEIGLTRKNFSTLLSLHMGGKTKREKFEDEKDEAIDIFDSIFPSDE